MHGRIFAGSMTSRLSW
jgi:hypothetical protein